MAIGLMRRALAWFNSQAVECHQVMSDNGPAYISRIFAKACKALGRKHSRTRFYTPRTKGTAEGFLQALCKACAFQNHFKTPSSGITGYPVSLDP